jgi:hypothetical protein
MQNDFSLTKKFVKFLKLQRGTILQIGNYDAK